MIVLIFFLRKLHTIFTLTAPIFILTNNDGFLLSTSSPKCINSCLFDNSHSNGMRLYLTVVLICTSQRISNVVYILEKAMAPHSSTLAWKIPWTEGPGGQQSMGSRSPVWQALAGHKRRIPLAVVLPRPARGAGTLIPSAQRFVWAAKQALGKAALGRCNFLDSPQSTEVSQCVRQL